MSRIFLVEDDNAIAKNLALLLRSEGFTVTHAATHKEALAALDTGKFDLALIDVSLPDGNGFSICTAVKSGAAIPVIFLTASADEASVVTGLNMGADDYITKPFRPMELIARIKAALRKSGRAPSTFEIAALHIDTASGNVTKNGKEVFLSALKYRLLLVFINNHGAIITRNQLADSLADIAHQLRTPLTSANLLLSFLAKNPDEQERQAFVRETEGLLARMDWLITSLLKLSRVDAGVVEFQNAPVPVGELVQSALRPLAIGMELRGIDLKIDVPGEAVIHGDLGWPSEALQNILKNCMENTPESGRVEIACAHNPLYTELVIHDSGPGFDKEDIPHLFDRFYRGKKANATGYGIGLALCKMIVSRQSGFVTAKNHPQGGAVFAVRFPKVEAEIEKLINNLMGASQTLMTYANAKIEELDTQRQSLMKRIADMTAEAVSPEQIQRISGYLDEWDNISFVWHYCIPSIRIPPPRYCANSASSSRKYPPSLFQNDTYKLPSAVSSGRCSKPSPKPSLFCPTMFSRSSSRSSAVSGAFSRQRITPNMSPSTRSTSHIAETSLLRSDALSARYCAMSPISPPPRRCSRISAPRS